MSANTGLGASLERKVDPIVPKELEEERTRRMDHYVFSPAIGFDFNMRKTKRRLYHMRIPRAQITLQSNLWYPTKDRSEEAFKTNSPDRKVLWEKTAQAQSRELVSAYNRVGLVGLSSITGVEPALVKVLQDWLLPATLWEDNTETGEQEPPDVPALLTELQVNARDRLRAISDHEAYPIAEALRLELIDSCILASNVCNELLDKTEMELEKARSGQKAKSSLDPLDKHLFRAMGRQPKAELLSKLDKQPQNITVQVENSAVQAQIAELRARLDQQMSGELKECPVCAETVKAKAIKCRFCQYEFKAEVKVEVKPVEPAITAAPPPVAKPTQQPPQRR